MKNQDQNFTYPSRLCTPGQQGVTEGGRSLIIRSIHQGIDSWSIQTKVKYKLQEEQNKTKLSEQYY